MRMSRVFANSLGDQNMVLESVDIEVETRLKGKQPVSSEVLVLRVRPKAGELGRCSLAAVSPASAVPYANLSWRAGCRKAWSRCIAQRCRARAG